MIHPAPRRRSGFLLPETFIAMSIFSAISLALMMGFVSLERNFAATTDFATNHTDAVRISDYLALDLRRGTIKTSAQDDITITIPPYYDANGAPLTPRVDGKGLVCYGGAGLCVSSNWVEIHYTLLNGAIYRQVGGAPKVAIAENVSDFKFNIQDLGKVVTSNITFSPIFSSGGASQNAIQATAVYNTTLLRNNNVY